MRYRNSIITLLFVVVVTTGYSQNEKNFSAFTGRTFYKPFVSEISSTLSNVSIGSIENTAPNGNKINAVMSEVHLGADIPLLYGENKSFKWGLSMPVSLHVLWATFEPITAPIVNNDYRFGLSFTGIAYLDNQYIKNISFKISPLAHESTHIGDEVTIYGKDNIENFYRINVSYEYYELGLTLNDSDTLKGNLLSARFGFMGLLNHSNDYYTWDSTETGNKEVYTTGRWAEYYIELNYTKTKGFLASETWHPSISVEFRNRVKYQYENPNKAKRTWNINAFIGYEYVPLKSKGVKSVGHYFRYYNGINPHGQLRNMDYTFMGYSLVLFY